MPFRQKMYSMLFNYKLSFIVDYIFTKLIQLAQNIWINWYDFTWLENSKIKILFWKYMPIFFPQSLLLLRESIATEFKKKIEDQPRKKKLSVKN